MFRALSSLRLFFSICTLLAAAFVYQTIFNKGGSIYGSVWFAALGLTLAINIAVCSFRRLKTAKPYFIFLHAGLVVIILGSFASRFYRFEAQLPLHTGAASSLAYTETASYTLPFSVELKNFEIEYYVAPVGRLTLAEGSSTETWEAKEGAVIKTPVSGTAIKILRLVRDFGLTAGNEVIEKSPYWFNPAVQLELPAGAQKKKLWFFSNFPGMHAQDLPFRISYALERADIKNFSSSVTVRASGKPDLPAQVAVNKPLRVGGYTLYQTSYDPADAGYSLLTVTMDRGAWVVYTGFALLLIGIFLWLRK